MMDVQDKTEGGYESPDSDWEDLGATPTIAAANPTSGEAGGQQHLWLRVIQAKNLPAVDGSSSDPQVKIRLSNDIDLTSRKVDKELNPNWHADFLIPSNFWKNSTSSLKLDIYDHNKIMKDKFIGSAEIHFETLFNDLTSASDIWLPVSGPKCSKDSQVRIVAALTSQAVNPTPAAVNGFRIHLERREWLIGETIRGHVIYSLSSPTKIRAIRLNCRGDQKIRWQETTVTRTNNGSSTSTSTFKALHHIFNVKSTILGAPKEMRSEITLAPGDYVLPFEFKLPADIPPSFEPLFGATAQLIYQVIANVDIPWAKDKVTALKFSVRRRPSDVNLKLAPSRSNPRVDLAEKIQVQLELQNHVFKDDTSAKIAVTISNESSVEIVRCVVYHLYKYRRYGGGGFGPLKQVSSTEYSKAGRVDLTNATAGSPTTHVIDVALNSDYTCIPTMEGKQCPYGRFHHRLVIFLVDVDGGNLFPQGLAFKLPILEKPLDTLLALHQDIADGQRLKPLQLAVIDREHVILEAHHELFVPRLWVGDISKPWGGYGPALPRADYEKHGRITSSVNEPFDEKYSIPTKQPSWPIYTPDIS